MANEGWISTWSNDHVNKRGEEHCTAFLEVPFIHEITIAFIFAFPLYRISYLLT